MCGWLVFWWSGWALPGAHAASAEALEARAAELKKALPAGYTVLIEAPWVVVGNEPPERVAARAETVRWATRRLEADFFPKRPAEVWTIWLFADDRSYREGATELLGHEAPSTPYGYALGGQLVMNIATGGGTLVHEMVHPYVDAQTTGAPAWLNEGLGSLFEQCGEREGHIVGLTNWRLAGLQQAIVAGTLPPFEVLFAQSSHGFYREDPGTNYGQSRYLLYWLQERGLLRTFWTRWLADREGDPTGVATLRRVLGTDDLIAWQADWERWVLRLRFP